MIDSKIILNRKYEFDDLKPGGFVIAKCFDHNVVFEIEDKGMEIRDKLYWFTKEGFEEYILCRKQLSEKSVVENILKHGTGGINIDACRIELNGDYKSKANGRPSLTKLGDNYNPKAANQPDTQGRFPSHLIHDGSKTVIDKFPKTSSGAMKREVGGYESNGVTGFLKGKSSPNNQHGDSGSASRFYKTIKTKEELIEYFKKMITPENGICKIEE